MREAIDGNLAVVRVAIEDCRRMLDAWYSIDWPHSAEEDTHRALEALTRAVSSLTLAVERLAESQ